MNSQAHEDIPWFASRPKFLPSREGDRAARGRWQPRPVGRPTRGSLGARADTADECGQGIAWGEVDAARGGDRTARGRTRGRLAGCPPCAGVSSSSIYDDMSLAGGGLWRERSWLLPRKLVLFLLYDLFACVLSLQILFEQCLMCFFV